jgi:hypothetical protein
MDPHEHQRAALRFPCQSAVDFDYDTVSVVVMFHPFGSETMRAVMARCQESLERRPRAFRIVYGNPIPSPMLAAKPFLQLHECWNPCTWSRVKFPVHFYRATILITRPGTRAAHRCTNRKSPAAHHGRSYSEVGLRCSDGRTRRSISRSIRPASERSGSTDSLETSAPGGTIELLPHSCRSASSQISTSDPWGHPRSVQIACARA